MELALFVYAAYTAQSIKLFLAVGGFSLSAAYFIWMFDPAARKSKPPKWMLWISISMITLLTFIPSERTMWMMAGAYGTQSVVQSEVGKKTLLLIEKRLDAELEKVMGSEKK
jgi:hypothetical protein